MKNLLITLFLFLNITCSFGFEFKENDKIVFIGNSITHAGSYHNVFRTFLATRLQKDITIYNKGISGDVTDQVLARLEVDILVEKPTVAFIMLGMNDVMRDLYTDTPTETQLKKQQNALDRYKKQTDKLVNLLLVQNIKIILFTPTPFDESPNITKQNNKGVNEALGKCALHIKAMASIYNLEVVDFYESMNKINIEEQKRNENFTIVGPDRIHPGTLGHFIMGYQLVNTITKEHRLVSSLSINLKKKKVKENINCKVDELSISKSNFSFTLTENSLPFPDKHFDKKGMLLIAFNENLNQEIIQFKGLKKGKYLLKIDNKEVETFTSNELKNGVSIATLNTPQLLQAEQVSQVAKEIMRLQHKIRDMRMVDYTIFKVYDNKMSKEEKVNLLNQKLEEFNDISISWHKYFQKLLTSYKENIDQEAIIKSEIEAKRSLLFKISKPTTHQYSVEKVTLQ